MKTKANLNVSNTDVKEMQMSGKKLIITKHELAKLQAKNVLKRGKMTRREVTVSNTSNGWKA